MAKFTTRVIMQTFEEMLTEMPFDRITVSALVARCEISSNTFYYHFRDIYDLLSAWLDQERDRLLRETEDIGDWAERLKAVFHEIQDNPKRVYHIADSVSRERLEHYIFTSVENQFYEIVKDYADGVAIEEQKLRGIAGFCCYSFLGFFLKFLWMRMDLDVDAAIDGMKELFQGALTYALERASDSF